MVKRVFGIFLLLVGIYFISQSFLNLAKRQGIFRLRTSNSPQIIVAPEDPLRIEIPHVKVNLPIYTAEISQEKWPTSESGVSYLKNSGKLGITGNLIMYGHNWKSLLGGLRYSKVGDPLTVYSQNKSYQFQIKYIAVVDSRDVSILADTTQERITLYTCIGFLDSQRLVVVAERVKS